MTPAGDEARCPSRTCHGSAPRPAGDWRRRTPRIRSAAWGLLLMLTACGSTTVELASDVGAVGVGGAVGAATGNPAIGLVAGLGAQLALDEGYLYAERRFYGSKQERIAAAGGRAGVGEVVPWTYDGPLDLGDSRGRVETVRRFGRHIDCKEIIFTVEPVPEARRAGDRQARRNAVPPVDPTSALPPSTDVFTTTLCRTPDGWAWAAGQPSTARWGGLQ